MTGAVMWAAPMGWWCRVSSAIAGMTGVQSCDLLPLAADAECHQLYIYHPGTGPGVCCCWYFVGLFSIQSCGWTHLLVLAVRYTSGSSPYWEGPPVEWAHPTTFHSMYCLGVGPTSPEVWSTRWCMIPVYRVQKTCNKCIRWTRAETVFVLFLSWDLKYTGLVTNFGPVPFVPCVTFIERFVQFLPQVSWTHVLISNSWQAWLGIVDQNWLKLALAKLALGQSISLKVVGMPTSIKTTVRSKLPFIYMKYLTYPANSTRNPIP